MKKIFILLISINYMLISNSSVGIIKSIKGRVEIKRADRVIVARVGTILKNSDIIMTQLKSSVGITFDDGSRLSLGAKSIFKINRFIVKPSKDEYDVDLKLKEGKALFNSGKIGKLSPKSFKFHVPDGVIGIRGTEFLVEVR